MDKYWVGFSSIEEVSSKFVLQLYNHFKNIEKAFNCAQKDLSEIEGLSIKKAEKFLKQRDSIDIDETFSKVINFSANLFKFLSILSEFMTKVTRTLPVNEEIR